MYSIQENCNFLHARMPGQSAKLSNTDHYTSSQLKQIPNCMYLKVDGENAVGTGRHSVE